MTRSDSATINSKDTASLQKIIDSIPVAAFIIGKNGTVIDCNKGTLRIFGAGSREEIVGKHPGLLAPQTQRNGRASDSESRKYIQKAHETGSVTFYFDHSTLSGSIFSAKVTLTKIEYEGEPCLLSSVTDMTGQVRIEENNTLIHENPYALVEMDPNLSVIGVNQAFLEMSGYKREDWIGRSFTDFEIIRRDGQTVNEAIYNKRKATGKLIIEFPNGVKTLEYAHIPVIDNTGEIPKIFAVFADNTELVEKINEAESLVRENPASILTMDLTGKILSTNPAFQQLSRISKEQLLTMKMQDFKILKREGRSQQDILASRQPSRGRLVVDFGWGVRTLDFTYIPIVNAKDAVTSLVSMYVDVTELLEKIHESESLIKENPASILTMDPSGKILSTNPAFQQLSRISKEQLLTMRVLDFKILKREGRSLQDILASRQPSRGRLVVDFGWGVRTLDFTYIPIVNANDVVTSLVSMYVDVTELLDKIHESESLVRENPASILTMDPSGKILSTNPAFQQLSRISEEKLLSMKLQDFKILEREGLSLQSILASKQPSRGRLVVDFGWAVRILDFTYIPIVNANDIVTSLVSMYVDVTDQISYIEEIKTFIRENPHAIITVTPDLSITDVNPAFSRITGYSSEQSLKMKLSDIKVLERKGKTLKDSLASKKPEGGKLIVETPAGLRHLECVYIPILDKNGEVQRFIEIFTDLTAVNSMIQYLSKSVALIQENISSIARGDTNFTSTVLDADEHSASAREEFVKINTAVETARNAITQLVNDSNTIAKSAIAGDLSFRSDPTIHEGDYRAIIEGMNQTLDSISIPIQESMKIAEAYSNYNFTARFDPSIKVKGDWTQFVFALNNMGIQVSEAISLITKNVTDLVTSTEEVHASIEEVLSGAQQIASNTGKVSQNAEQGNDGIAQVLKAMEDLNVTVGAVSRKVESVSVASDEANNLAKTGVELAKQSEKAMTEITLSANEVDSIVTGINSQMDEIGKIVRLISDIANQTNLLALNAAIEAARAGEAGRGFAVVAAEVKSLAQDSRKSAENIEDMIATLQTKAKQATEAMGKSTHAVQDGSSALKQTLSAFDQIATTIEDINRNTVEVASASEEQAASVEEVTASIQEVSNLVQNTSHEAGDAAAATEETSASIEEIGRIMNGVVTIAESISGEMTKFRVA
ncbi:PAS domain-containing protein [uncultured Methanospirillum sp.]|uniref:methyl-accepting chemotaxis protein n=1 Tax=uncultured Methanospirillum sp. TaxID=262503 RepID=UPI0029C8CEEF|nr:PAS domain-containing protein [uncultured Methanospirillum sp.]